MRLDVSTLLLLAELVSFAGFCIENLFLCIGRGYIDNRNMSLPFIMGYGLSILGFYRILGIPEKGGFWGYFAAAFISVCIGEIVVGKTAEHVLGFRYWDYSNIPLHITRYTSVPSSAGFAIMITLFMKYWFMPITSKLSAIPIPVRRIAGISTAVLLICDLVRSVLTMYRAQAPNPRWKLQLFRKRPRSAI